MRTRTLGAIAALLVALTSQTAVRADQPAVPTAPTMGAPMTNVECCDTCCGGHAWVRGEALWWWTRGQKLPPLVTTSPDFTPIEDAGVLGLETTTILFGDDRYNHDGEIGFRISGEYWLDNCRSCAIGANFFWLNEQETTFHAASDDLGFPIIARPFFDIEQGFQNSLLVAYPFFVAGSIDISTSTEFMGAEIYGRKNLCQSCTCRVDGLVGFKWLRLEEDLRIDEVEINIGDEATPLGTRFDLHDQFDTENSFYGVVLGLAAEVEHGCWTLEVIGKVGLGVTHKHVNIAGSTLISVPDETPELFPGGLLALPSNIGNYDRTDFGVVPELNINVGYQICDCARAFAGYTFIYWHDVARPGDQIDLGIEQGQIPPADPNGFTRPAFKFKDTDFWAQGFSLGLEFRY